MSGAALFEDTIGRILLEDGIDVLIFESDVIVPPVVIVDNNLDGIGGLINRKLEPVLIAIQSKPLNITGSTIKPRLTSVLPIHASLYKSKSTKKKIRGKLYKRIETVQEVLEVGVFPMYSKIPIHGTLMKKFESKLYVKGTKNNENTLKLLELYQKL